jgi:hypothetical protein
VTLIRITARHFCAGVEVRKEANFCAPILAYMRRWTIDEIRDYCRRKGWRLEEIPMT